MKIFRSLWAIMAIAMLSGCAARNAASQPQPPETHSDTYSAVYGETLAEAYDVVVAGGEPEGVAAALSASRNGMSTLLIEKGDALGGLMTLGMLNFIDMNRGPNGELLTRGIFSEFFEDLGNAFDIEKAKDWFMSKCLAEPNLTVLLNTDISRPVMDGNTVTGLEFRTQGGAITVARAGIVIDATADGDVAAAAGAPYTVGGDDYGAYGTKQGVTLVFEVSGVDWDAVCNFLQNDGSPYTGADSATAWGYVVEARDYVSADGNMRFRAPNIARSANGNVLLNGLIIFGVDATDPLSYNEGIARGSREIPHVISFVRENFTGFENAVFAGHAPRLYVRETRHFIGEYRLTITDVLENRDHPDRIGHGSYPVDMQATNPDNYGKTIGNPDIYSIPFRCLVPLVIDRLLIAGRSASFDSLAHGSARVVPVGMVTGEACGAAAAYCVDNGVTPRQMAYDPEAILWLQNRLISQGAYLVEYEPPRIEAMDHWAYPGMAVMRELGMVSGGYPNDYRLDSGVVHSLELQNRINRLMKVLSERTAENGEYHISAWTFTLPAGGLTTGQLLITAAECASLGDRERYIPGGSGAADSPQPTIFSGAVDARGYLVDLGILDEGLPDHYTDFDATATNGQLLSILGALYTALINMAGGSVI